jgi:precorrin-6Y C5,15-methyltransferase (decarboxylating)
MIDVIGIGLNGIDGLSKQTIQILAGATVLVGSERHLQYFLEHRAKKIVLRNFQDVVAEINIYLQQQEKIVVLASGDPLFFGLGRLLMGKFKPGDLHFYPHLSSVQLAFNRLKISWQDAIFFSAHGRPIDSLSALLQEGKSKIAILTDATNTPQAIARFYQSLNLPVIYDFYICENLEAEAEQIHQFSAAQIPQLAQLTPNYFSPLNVVILLRQDEPGNNLLEIERLPAVGISDRTFISFSDRPGLMTKKEIRLLVLGELGLQAGQIIWDIGAGTGSVSIEIARLCPSSRVYAIEKTAVGSTLIEQNCQRLQADNVIVVSGSAPEILEQLPAPQRIFIGGSGGRLRANLTRFSPLNPVTIITAKPPSS